MEPVYYSDTRGSNLFAYKVSDTDMWPPFRPGDEVIVNPNIEARDGDYVLIRKGAECMLKLYVETTKRGGLLISTGVDAPPIPQINAVILGRVVEGRRAYR